MELTVMSGNKGFTLVEMLISVVLMSIIMLGLAYSLVIVQQRNLSLLIRKKAEETIQAHLEDLRSRKLSEIVDQPRNIGAMSLSTTKNLNTYCDPNTGQAPDDPFSRGDLVLRKPNGDAVSNIEYETVYKVFNTVSDKGIVLEGTKTIIATICWSYRGKLSYISRKTILQTGGL
jgi:prepilin-type N-terminal cleavage/methylation domain-containing protein